MKYGRNGHSAILVDGKVLIIGGYVKGDPVLNNEVCTFSGSTMTCVEQSIALKGYSHYPELFVVADDFGEDKSKC